MKKILSSTIIFIFLICISTKSVLAESLCLGIPTSGNYTVSTADALGCYITASGQTDGLDSSGNLETSTSNNAKLIVPTGKSLTIPSGISASAPTTLVVGSLQIQDGGNISIGTNAQIKIGVPLYMLDSDSDGRPDSLNYSISTASGKRRKSLAASYAEADCAPYDNTKWQNYTGYVDLDHDGFGVGALKSNICSGSTIDTKYVANNNTDCNDNDATIHRSVAGYIDTDNDGYGAGTYKTCVGDSFAYVANNLDCDNNLAAATGKKTFGTTCTPTTYGSGDDGAVTFSGTQSINTFANTGRSYADGVTYAVSSLGTNTITISSTPNGIGFGDEVMLINLQGDSTNYSNVGNYENFYVTNVSGNTLTLYNNITKTYGVGNNSTLTGQKIVVQRVPNYTTVSVGNGVTLTSTAFNGTKGGLLTFRANSTVTVSGSISATGLGYRGGNGGVGGYGGEAYCGINSGAGYQGRSSGLTGSCGGGGGGAGACAYQFGGGSGGSIGGAGGGGGCAQNGYAWLYGGGGGGGGYGTYGSAGRSVWSTSYGTDGGTNTSGGGGLGDYSGGGSCGTNYDNVAGGGGGGGTYGSSSLSKLYFGSAGGQGGGTYSVGNGIGGAGGGIILINAYNISLSGNIQSNGGNGTSATTSSGNAGGGGGAGGSIYLKTDTQTALSNITVTGGSGGVGSGRSSTANYGGAGGSGRTVIVQ